MAHQVIAISGNMGAGKTTLSRALASNLSCPLILWDDFDAISKSPEDYVDWYQRGRNYAEWDYPKLAEVLNTLKSGEKVVHPATNSTLTPAEYIIFDAPLGRLHQQTGVYIDTWIHIDVPLDISLCRWLIRDYRHTNTTSEALLDELEFYLNQSRPLFDDTQFKAHADLNIDGMDSTKQQTETIRRFLRIYK